MTDKEKIDQLEEDLSDCASARRRALACLADMTVRYETRTAELRALQSIRSTANHRKARRMARVMVMTVSFDRVAVHDVEELGRG